MPKREALSGISRKYVLIIIGENRMKFNLEVRMSTRSEPVRRHGISKPFIERPQFAPGV